MGCLNKGIECHTNYQNVLFGSANINIVVWKNYEMSQCNKNSIIVYVSIGLCEP